ncbi:MAG: lipoyl synthase [Deltaproteobacteria bacterium]|nr:MAG: lipoyl synthase [Deltaproteobacteria bacterium]
MTVTAHKPLRAQKPKWLKKRLPTGPEYEKMRRLLKENKLHTVCQEAQCPNQFECFSEGTATFMILGERCTRNCRFCAVSHRPLAPPDSEEPRRVAEAAVLLDLKYVVITSVTRDDQPDGGAQIFAETITAIKKQRPGTRVEVLIPDLQGDQDALMTILEAQPDVLNHNLETVSRLYDRVRPEAVYQRSLQLFKETKRIAPNQITKSGIMLGLGENDAELREAWQDLIAAGCDILTLGQYLQPSKKHLAVQRFVTPDEFTKLEQQALADGFRGVASGPFIRSSYQAEKLFRTVQRSRDEKHQPIS